MPKPCERSHAPPAPKSAQTQVPKIGKMASIIRRAVELLSSMLPKRKNNAAHAPATNAVRRWQTFDFLDALFDSCALLDDALHAPEQFARWHFWLLHFFRRHFVTSSPQSSDCHRAEAA